MPVLTVIMPAYRAAGTIGGSIRSTLRAMPRDARLVVGVDGPDAATEAAARAVADPRVVVRVHERNQGSVACTRRLLLETDGEFVAKMDADDYCLPWRFRLELAAVRHADIVCGTGIRFGAGIPRPSYFGSLTSREIGALLPFTNPLFHPSMLARRQSLLDANAYAVDSPAEDYVLWHDALLNGARLAKLATPVIAYRLSEGQISGASDYHQRVEADPEVRRVYEAWARANNRMWLLEDGGTPSHPRVTAEHAEEILSQVRPVTRPYARRQIALHASPAGSAC
ncbi:glycosyltransferase family 2 protein [Kocuria varians]|uniref:glycosyltransferase family 2 protein n=1 Tax=Kocuria varians TaxID=1272 RepID=UPI00083848DD|nr:glycosyltransferase family 2 protein [Kocuria varians]